MPNSLPKLTYTAKDFEEIRDQLVNAIPLVTDRWTDFNESDVGVTLLELWAAIGDMLAFYLDQQANETFLETARQRKNVINLCKLIAYKLDHVVSSTSIVEFSLEAPHTARIEMPKFTRLATGGDDVVYFSTTVLATIPTGDTSVLVGVRQGIPKHDLFNTDGSSDQRYRLSEKAVDLNSIEVVVDNVVWSKVDSFVNAQSSDRVFTVEVDADSNIDILFGNGFFGFAPPTSAINNVLIDYLVSIGSDGNVGINVITTLLDTITDIKGGQVSLAVTNIQAATGGSEQESIEHARQQAPAELSALFRAMTKADYVALTEGFGGVGKANAWGEQDESPPDYNLYNWIMLAIAPESVTREALIDDSTNNGKPSTQLKTDILNFLEERKCITTRIKIVDPIYKPVDIQANIYYSKGHLPSTVKADVEGQIIDFFDFSNVIFGKEVRKSNVIRLMDSVSGVEYVELTQLRTVTSISQVEDVLVLNKYELPFLRNFSISMFKASDTPARAAIYPCPPEQPAPVD